MDYEKGTFVVVPNKQHLSGKPSEMQAVYFWLVEHSNDMGSCFPSKKTLAKEAGCSINTVNKYIKQLVTEGFVVVKPRKSETNPVVNTSNLYQLQVLQSNLNQGTPKNVGTGTPKNEALTITSINSNQLTKSTEGVFNFKIYLEGALENAKTKNIPRYFALYFIKRKGLVFKDSKSLEATVRQWLWAGKVLAEFVGDTEKIKEAFNRSENFAINGRALDWDLKTVVNQIRKL